MQETTRKGPQGPKIRPKTGLIALIPLQPLRP